MTDGSLRREESRDTLILWALIAAVGAISIAMVLQGRSTALEAVGFATGAICVWLVVKENIWNFPLGLINTAASAVLFYEARLFGDASLNVLYFVLNAIGWYMWLRGGEKNTALVITRATSRDFQIAGAAVVVSTLVLWEVLHSIGGSASFFDALTTSISVGAQWLLNQKKLENWHLWIIVDAIYVPLYISRQLNLMALLYAVFFVMAVIGLRGWKAALDAQAGKTAAAPVV